MEKVFKAQVKYLRIAPRKVRLLATLLKGLTVVNAQAQLMHAPQRSAPALLKLLRSAMANAKTQGVDPEKLVITHIVVDSGPMMKRFLPRARGMATPLQKKMSHVTLELTENSEIKNRFTIITKKKVKKDGEPVKEVAKPKAPRADKKKEEASGDTDKAGLVKRVFRRKSTGAAGK